MSKRLLVVNEATEHPDPFLPPKSIGGDTEIQRQKFDWITGIVALIVVMPIAFVAAVFVLSPLAAILASVMSFSGGSDLSWICQPVALVIAACFALWMALSVTTLSFSNPESVQSSRHES